MSASEGLKPPAHIDSKMPPKARKSKGKGAAAVEPPPIPPVESLYYRLYDETVAKYGDKVAILLQVGKFFEMYDQVDIATGTARANVQALTELCGCAIEHRPSRDPTKTRLFWGFPEASLRKFERVLILAGYSTFPFIQNKDGTGEVVSRSLDHIGSPGTFWDAEGGLAVRKEEQILLSVYVEPWNDSATRLSHWYIASTAFDVMTGKVVSTETDLVLIDGKPVFDAIQPFWSMFPPAEVLFLWCAPPSQPPPKEKDLAALFSARRPLLHIRHVEHAVEITAAQDRLRLAFFTELFKPKTALSIAEYLDVVMVPLVRRSLFHLLQFVKDHNQSYLTGLHDHRLWNPDDTVLLGNAALEQLAMIPCHVDRQHESLLHWLQKALTAMGKRSLRERCLKPLADVAVLEARQERIAALRRTEAAGGTERDAIQGILRGAFDLSRLYRRFQLGHGTTDDLLQLLSTYEKAERLLHQIDGKAVDTDDAEELGIHVRTLLDRWDAVRIRASKAQVSDGIAVGSTHPWKRGIHPALDAIEDRWSVLEAQMITLKQRWETHLEESEAITWSLKDDAPFSFTTTARRAACLAAIAKRVDKTDVRIVKRGASTTVTLESDALAAANGAAIALRNEWKETVATTWASDWITWMEEAIEEGFLETMVDWIGTLDAECALAGIADEYGYVRPTYVESTEEAVAGVSITDLRHPIIERIHAGTPYIPHSLAMGSLVPSTSGGADAGAKAAATTSCGLLLYGVNAAGKSSLGKALGLAVLMAQCGMPVPATAMTLIPYTGVFTRILGNDNLWAGMSSFVVEMTEFRSILRSANARTLVIGDELCAGTETASATAIVAAGIQTLVRRGSHFLFATHLHELMELPELTASEAVRPYHLTVQSDARRGVLLYDRRLKAGCGSPMYGLEVCRGLDMDREFLAAAFEIRRRVFAEDGKARPSRYNASVVVASCAVCGGRGGSLETHHIVPQAAARGRGTISPGVSVHAPHNLAPLCEACHRKHHTGVLDIQGWVATTEGVVLQVV